MTPDKDFQGKDPKEKAERGELDPASYAIAQAVTEARREAGLTQRELSRKSGVNQGWISKLENGEGNPSLSTLQRLAEAMGMQLEVSFVPHSEAPKDSAMKPVQEEPYPRMSATDYISNLLESDFSDDLDRKPKRREWILKFIPDD